VQSTATFVAVKAYGDIEVQSTVTLFPIVRPVKKRKKIFILVFDVVFPENFQILFFK
jgi:hypothetical protein